MIKTERDECTVFVITVSGGEFTFNPQLIATQIVTQQSRVLTNALGVAPSRDRLKKSVALRIMHMIAASRTMLDFSMRALPEVAGVMATSEELGPFNPGIKERLTLSVLGMWDDRLRDILRLERAQPGAAFDSSKKRGAKRAINDYQAMQAIVRLGGRPSRERLAKELGVKPATVLNWARGRGFKSLETVMNFQARLQQNA